MQLGEGSPLCGEDRHERLSLLEVAGNPEQVRVNGSNGIVTELSGASAYGETERDVC